MRRLKPTRVGVSLLGLALVLTGVAADLSAQERKGDEAAMRRLMLEAEKREDEGDLAAALRDYELLVQQFPASRGAATALLRLAEGRYRAGDNKGAEAAARQLVEDYRRTAQAAGAFVLLARLQTDWARSPADLEEARATFRSVWVLFGAATYPDLEWRSAARVLSGELALRLGSDEEAAACFVVALEDEPASAWTGRARLGLATVLLARGDWQAAAEILQRAADSHDPGTAGSEEAAAARRRLTLLHRLIVRPLAGEPRWQRARRLPVQGLSLKRPNGVAAHEDGRLVISDEKASVVAIVDPDGRSRLRQSHQAAKRPSWGPDDRVYVAADQALLLPLKSGRQVFVQPASEKNAALTGIAAAERGTFGDWLILSGRPEQVLLYGPDGGYRRTLIHGGKREPVDLARDFRHRLYVLDQQSSSVLRFGADGSEPRKVATGTWKKPEALAIDLLGNIYVLDGRESRIEVYGADGRRLETVGPRLPGGIELRAPLDLTVDGSGRLYVADARIGGVVVLE